jgi:hypothetical protein
VGLEPTTGFPAPNFLQSEPGADAISGVSITAARSCDAKEKAAELPGDAQVTVEPATAGHYWPDDIEAGDGALEDLKVIWPFLSRELRLAIVAIANFAEQQKPDVDGRDVYPVSESDLIPF